MAVDSESDLANIDWVDAGERHGWENRQILVCGIDLSARGVLSLRGHSTVAIWLG